MSIDKGSEALFYGEAALRDVCTSEKPQLFISRCLHSFLLDHDDGGSYVPTKRR
jgi:hypothetical protein